MNDINLFKYMDSVLDQGYKNEAKYWKTLENGSIVTAVNAPGLDKETLKAEIAGRRLRLYGSNSVSEYDFSFDISVTVPAGYKPRSAKIKILNGVIFVTVEKLEPDYEKITVE